MGSTLSGLISLVILALDIWAIAGPRGNLRL